VFVIRKGGNKVREGDRKFTNHRPMGAIHLFRRELTLDWWDKEFLKRKLEIKFDKTVGRVSRCARACGAPDFSLFRIVVLGFSFRSKAASEGDKNIPNDPAYETRRQEYQQSTGTGRAEVRSVRLIKEGWFRHSRRSLR